MLWQIGVYLKLLNTILDYFIHKKEEEEEQQQHTQKKTKNVNCVCSIQLEMQHLHKIDRKLKLQ